VHTSAYVSIRQHTSAYVSIRQHTSAYVSIRRSPEPRPAAPGTCTCASIHTTLSPSVGHRLSTRPQSQPCPVTPSPPPLSLYATT
jgi:hypothetical protein